MNLFVYFLSLSNCFHLILEALSYFLFSIFSYARCTRSVSIGLLTQYSVCFFVSHMKHNLTKMLIFYAVPAAYYAHLLAFRARYYLNEVDTSDSGSATGNKSTTNFVSTLPSVMENVKDVMFYC